VPAELEKLLRDQNRPIPAPVQGYALIDTGASLTMVDRQPIESLGLAPIGTVTLGTAAGPSESALYPVRLLLGMPPEAPLVVAELAQVASGPLSQQNLVCLVGRDVLQRALLVYDGPGGRFTIAF